MTEEVPESITTSLNELALWLSDQSRTDLQVYMNKKPFGMYHWADKTQGLTASITMESTALGINFVTVKLDLMHPEPRVWGSGSKHAVYFQIEMPMPLEEDAKRMLQDVPTGTGEYEGWLGVLAGGKASGPVTLLANKNLWGPD